MQPITYSDIGTEPNDTGRIVVAVLQAAAGQASTTTNRGHAEALARATIQGAQTALEIEFQMHMANSRHQLASMAMCAKIALAHPKCLSITLEHAQGIIKGMKGRN